MNVPMRQLAELVLCHGRTLQHRRSMAWLGPLVAGFLTHDIVAVAMRDSWTGVGTGIAAFAVAAFYSFRSYRRFERRWARKLTEDMTRIVATDLHGYLSGLERELFSALAEQEAPLPRDARDWPQFLEQGRARMALARKKGVQGDTQEDCSST